MITFGQVDKRGRTSVELTCSASASRSSRGCRAVSRGRARDAWLWQPGMQEPSAKGQTDGSFHNQPRLFKS